MSIKFQVTLPDDLASELRQEARRQQVPLAEFIRQTMRAHLEAVRHPSASEDPFEPVSNLVASDESDLASRVDEYLYR